ncbi:chaperone modulator CbpM [Nocardia albiluteola]|uniref:chaperone modulator CbpM n=1 Tax=Nocardia albiluteola TaxID=2842303 RepID=UPI001FDA3B92|nr:chaperone modulator CbpM [Nocardia albiluteola]
MTAPRTRALVAVQRLDADGTPLVTLDVVAVESGLHPELVRRLVALGALEPSGSPERPLFRRDSAARLARIQRLRIDLGLNYAGALLAADLIARIDALEHLLAHRHAGSERNT